jgi:cyclic-di-AMP phosphodiesterase PgpH
VVEGLKLADQHKLPDAVKAFIAQHHGTQPISFFLQQARDRDPTARVEARDYAYLGPKPQTREVAVVMLADSVESAARVLQDPSTEKIRELVDRIVNGKIAAGQLDQCPLTLKEISITKEVLVRALGSMYHHRVDYPAAANGTAEGSASTSPANGDAKAAAAPGGAGSGVGDANGTRDEPAPAGAGASAGDATGR